MELKLRFRVLRWAQACSFKICFWHVTCKQQHPPHSSGWLNMLSTYQSRCKTSCYVCLPHHLCHLVFCIITVNARAGQSLRCECSAKHIGPYLWFANWFICKSYGSLSWCANRFNLVYEKLPTLPRCCLPQRWIDEVGKPFVHIFYSCLEYYCSRKETYSLLYIVDGSLVVCRHCLFCIKSILWAPIGVFLFSLLLDAIELWS